MPPSGRIVRRFPAILALAACLHAVGIGRSALPAQDGLKILGTAREFQTRPWADVVRGTDRHPLYPALVALAEPPVSAAIGRGPDAWRVAGQLVAAAAAIGLLVPLRSLTRSLFGPAPADLAALGFVLLPVPMAVGHETLPDSLALAAFLLSLTLGLRALTNGTIRAAVGCGLAAGVGFLARPEALLAPCAVGAAGLLAAWRPRVGLPRPEIAPRLAGVGLSFLVVVGAYALVKGEVSEKLALRNAAGLTASASAPTPAPDGARRSGHWLPPGLDDPAWDFSPKEEPPAPAARPLSAVAADLAGRWVEGLGYALAGFALWGLGRDLQRRWSGGVEPADPPARLGRLLVAAHVLLFLPIVVRHDWRMGYLSDRHILTLVVLALPWAAFGVRLVGVRVGGWIGRPEVARRLGALVVLGAIALSATVQVRPPHPSRWGHLAAGLWLRANARPGEALLDTRGWAAFVSGVRSYDYWHVRQALTDARLAYVVVGEDEYRAPSRRAATLRALLAHAAEPAVAFPGHLGGDGVGVRVFRFRRPDSWEGLRP